MPPHRERRETHSHPRNHRNIHSTPKKSQKTRQKYGPVHTSTHDHHRTYQGQVYSSVEPLTSDDNQDSQECKFPRFPSIESDKSLRRTIIAISWLLLAIAIVTQIIYLVFTVIFVLTKTTGYDSQSPDYPFYKNSRFKECSAAIPSAQNCTAIISAIRSSPIGQQLNPIYLDKGYTPMTTKSEFANGSRHDWCQFASCFHDFKVIPSTGPDSIIGLTTFDLWGELNMTAISALLTFVKRNWTLYKKSGEKCKFSLKELGIIDWGVLLYSICGPIIWWWISFVRFVMGPVPNATISIFAWATTWLLTSNIHYHPFSCIIHTRPSLRRFLSFILPFLTISQWGATIYLLAIGWSDNLQNYTATKTHSCIKSLLPTAPGTLSSNCTTQRLCSDPILLSSPPFYWAFQEHNIYLGGIAFLSILTLVALQPFLFTLLKKVSWNSTKSKYTWRRQFWRVDIGPIFGPGLAGAFAIFLCGMASAVLLDLWKNMNREAPVVADMRCRAVHVGLSSWRYYLDLGDYARVVRVMRPWFNA